MAKKGKPLGIDIGGSGVKGAPVDLKKGDLHSKRLRIETPRPATPDAVLGVVEQLVDHFADQCQDAPVGITVPAIVRHGTTMSAANIDKTWIGYAVEDKFSQRLGRPVTVVNDADAAGYAELHYGAAAKEDGLVLMTTLGTGIGSALLYRNQLVPNSELGHLQFKGMDAEKYAASSIKDSLELSYPDYAARLQEYYDYLCLLFSPDLLVVGGGISKDSEQFLPLLHLSCPIVPAQLLNQAGIVGAARLATEAAGLAIAKDGSAKS